jgi:phage shock protein PspC (stress-responsive transcriptional regulator)
MSLSDELNRLSELRQSGSLSDEEFARAKGRLLYGQGPEAAAPLTYSVNPFRRSRHDRWIAGVCGGIAHATGVESWVWRLFFTVLLICGGTGLLVYFLLAIFVPNE